jgi:hypothetical protein
VLDDRPHRVQLLGAIGDLAGAAEHDRRAVVHRVVVNGAREHESVEERRGHADVDSALQVPQHS